MSIDKELQRKIDCFKYNCQYAENHCIVYHGCDCVRLGGAKIPCQRSLGHNHNYVARDPLGVGICDGWQTREGR